MESFRKIVTQWSDGAHNCVLAGIAKSYSIKTKSFSGFWICFAVFVASFYMSSCSENIGELEKEVKKVMINTMREKGQSLSISSFSLVHKEGNNYEGLAAGTLDGEKIELDVYVVYDGTSFKAEWQPTAEYVQKESQKNYEEQQREYDRMMKENQRQQEIYQREAEKAIEEAEMYQKQLEMQMNTNDWNEAY